MRTFKNFQTKIKEGKKSFGNDLLLQGSPKEQKKKEVEPMLFTIFQDGDSEKNCSVRSGSIQRTCKSKNKTRRAFGSLPSDEKNYEKEHHVRCKIRQMSKPTFLSARDMFYLRRISLLFLQASPHVD